MILVCHLIFEDHVIEVLGDFIGKSPSRQVTILSSLVALVTLVGRYVFSFSRGSRRPRDQRVV